MPCQKSWRWKTGGCKQDCCSIPLKQGLHTPAYGAQDDLSFLRKYCCVLSWSVEWKIQTNETGRRGKTGQYNHSSNAHTDHLLVPFSPEGYLPVCLLTGVHIQIENHFWVHFCMCRAGSFGKRPQTCPGACVEDTRIASKFATVLKSFSLVPRVCWRIRSSKLLAARKWTGLFSQLSSMLEPTTLTSSKPAPCVNNLLRKNSRYKKCQSLHAQRDLHP